MSFYGVNGWDDGSTSPTAPRREARTGELVASLGKLSDTALEIFTNIQVATFKDRKRTLDERAEAYQQALVGYRLQNIRIIARQVSPDFQKNFG